LLAYDWRYLPGEMLSHRDYLHPDSQVTERQKYSSYLVVLKVSLEIGS
jgi:hypothetical protein